MRFIDIVVCEQTKASFREAIVSLKEMASLSSDEFAVLVELFGLIYSCYKPEHIRKLFTILNEQMSQPTLQGLVSSRYVAWEYYDDIDAYCLYVRDVPTRGIEPVGVSWCFSYERYFHNED
jgi:hypothetical protein